MRGVEGVFFWCHFGWVCLGDGGDGLVGCVVGGDVVCIRRVLDEDRWSLGIR